MAAASATDLEAERAGLQSAITAARATTSPNAVAAYHAYASWLIAHTPRDKNTLFTLLREGTEAYRDDKSLYADPNFADLWLWYAARVNKPNAVYTFCIRRKIGTERAKLYVEYAAYLVKANEYVMKIDQYDILELIISQVVRRQKLSIKLVSPVKQNR